MSQPGSIGAGGHLEEIIKIKKKEIFFVFGLDFLGRRIKLCKKLFRALWNPAFELIFARLSQTSSCVLYAQVRISRQQVLLFSRNALHPAGIGTSSHCHGASVPDKFVLPWRHPMVLFRFLSLHSVIQYEIAFTFRSTPPSASSIHAPGGFLYPRFRPCQPRANKRKPFSEFKSILNINKQDSQGEPTEWQRSKNSN